MRNIEKVIFAGLASAILASASSFAAVDQASKELQFNFNCTFDNRCTALARITRTFTESTTVTVGDLLAVSCDQRLVSSGHGYVLFSSMDPLNGRWTLWNDDSTMAIDLGRRPFEAQGGTLSVSLEAFSRTVAGTCNVTVNDGR